MILTFVNAIPASRRRLHHRSCCFDTQRSPSARKPLLKFLRQADGNTLSEASSGTEGTKHPTSELSRCPLTARHKTRENYVPFDGSLFGDMKGQPTFVVVHEADGRLVEGVAPKNRCPSFVFTANGYPIACSANLITRDNNYPPV